MRLLLSDERAKPPLKWKVQIRTKAATNTPITLTIIVIVGNLITGTSIFSAVTFFDHPDS
jgi:hypothetical protein